MVRGFADRAFLPAKSLFEQVGNMMVLTGKTLVATVRPPYPYGGEFIGQFLFALQLTWFPMLISTVAFGFGAPGLQAANFLSIFGALDRLGGFFVLASIREFAPFVTAVVVAGVAGMIKFDWLFWLAGRGGYQIVLAPEGVPTISVSYWAFVGPALLWIGAALQRRRIDRDRLVGRHADLV